MGRGWKLDKDSKNATQENTQDGERVVTILEGASASVPYIQVINNDVYFYSEVERENAVQLIKFLKDRINEHQILQLNYGLELPPKINLHIQSYGGSAHTGFGLLDTIENFPIEIDTIIEGVAASAATLISLAGRRRYITRNSYILIHQISSYVYGTYEEITDEKENLDKMMEALSKIYLSRTKLTQDKLNEILKRDLYFTAEEALEIGLVDEII